MGLPAVAILVVAAAAAAEQPGEQVERTSLGAEATAACHGVEGKVEGERE